MSHGTKRPTGQNVSRDKMSYTNYQVFYNTFCVRKFAIYVAVDNGLHLCTQFMIGVFLFWRGLGYAIPGTLCPWDVLSLRPFVPGTFFPLGRLVRGTLCIILIHIFCCFGYIYTSDKIIYLYDLILQKLSYVYCNVV